MGTAHIYQYLYDQHPYYGRSAENHCPGVRFFPHYADWLEAPVLDLGCGTGDTVLFSRDRGMAADGIDQVRVHPGMRVGDICEPVSGIGDYATGLCIDVLEHISDDKVEGVLRNLKQCKKQVISVHNKPAVHHGPHGEELHINIKPFAEWAILVNQYCEVVTQQELSDVQRLFCCRRRE